MTTRRAGGGAAAPWDAALVRGWLEARIRAARADQAAAQRGGRDREDDCDLASAEELVCAALLGQADDRAGFLGALAELLDREDHRWRGVYDDRRFDRHVRAHARRLVRMAKANDGFGNRFHHQ